MILFYIFINKNKYVKTLDVHMIIFWFLKIVFKNMDSCIDF